MSGLSPGLEASAEPGSPRKTLDLNSPRLGEAEDTDSPVVPAEATTPTSKNSLQLGPRISGPSPTLRALMQDSPRAADSPRPCSSPPPELVEELHPSSPCSAAGLQSQLRRRHLHEKMPMCTSFTAGYKLLLDGFRRLSESPPQQSIGSDSSPLREDFAIAVDDEDEQEAAEDSVEMLRCDLTSDASSSSSSGCEDPPLSSICPRPGEPSIMRENTVLFSEQSLDAEQSAQVACVDVPDVSVAGGSFEVSYKRKLFSVKVPDGNRPGDKLPIRLPMIPPLEEKRQREIFRDIQQPLKWLRQAEAEPVPRMDAADVCPKLCCCSRCVHECDVFLCDEARKKVRIDNYRQLRGSQMDPTVGPILENEEEIENMVPRE